MQRHAGFRCHATLLFRLAARRRLMLRHHALMPLMPSDYVDKLAAAAIDTRILSVSIGLIIAAAARASATRHDAAV